VLIDLFTIPFHSFFFKCPFITSVRERPFNLKGEGLCFFSKTIFPRDGGNSYCVGLDQQFSPGCKTGHLDSVSSLHIGQVGSTSDWLNLLFSVCSMYVPVSILAFVMACLTSRTGKVL
jgi:hypothetical protein